MNKAFTLVELAIVIVIIGLLVGGVLQGQELIRQAKISAQVKQLEDFNAAAVTFYGKYNFIPGDVPASKATQFTMSSSAYNNGDGRLSDYVGNVPTLMSYAEPLLFMVNLYEKKLIKDQMRTVPNDYSVGISFPEAKLGSGGIAAVGLTDGVYYYIGPTIKNDNGANSAAFVTNSPTPALNPSDAYGIDAKLDDGIPSTGIIRSARVTNSTTTTFTNETTLNSCLGATNQSYNFTTDRNTCRIIVKSKIN